MSESIIDNKTILITGGTGSLGQKLTVRILNDHAPKKIIIFSRDEFKQYLMKEELRKLNLLEKVRFFIGNVRDKDRLYRAFNGVDYVIHAAALKQVPSCEYNPFEAVQTNIHGAQNIIDAAIDNKIHKVVALSTDKAVNPVNLYGATKLCSDKLFISGNAYSGENGTTFSVVRYGNVSGSRGAVIPKFIQMTKDGIDELPITDDRMTRFWITLDEAVDMVIRALNESQGAEVYIPKIPSFKITDLAYAINPDVKLNFIGIRPGEKLHEALIAEDDSRSTFEFDSYYIVYPSVDPKILEVNYHKGGNKVKEGFEYTSNINDQWLDTDTIRQKLKELNFY